MHHQRDAPGLHQVPQPDSAAAPLGRSLATSRPGAAAASRALEPARSTVGVAPDATRRRPDSAAVCRRLSRRTGPAPVAVADPTTVSPRSRRQPMTTGSDIHRLGLDCPRPSAPRPRRHRLRSPSAGADEGKAVAGCSRLRELVDVIIRRRSRRVQFHVASFLIVVASPDPHATVIDGWTSL